MANFNNFMREGVEAIKNAIEDSHGNYFESIVVGKRDPNRLDFPAVFIIPEDHTHVNNTEYEQTITVDYYFKINRGYDDMDYLNLTDVIEETMDSIYNEVRDNTSNFFAFRPSTINHFVGGKNNLIFVISVDWRLSQSFEYTD